MTRAERAARFGGATMGGIQPSASTPNVFLYSDPSAGERFGYNFDGWSSQRDVFLYTGEGRRGDQELRAGNLALVRHREMGRVLRLFVALHERRRSGGKRHRYIGEFTVDPAWTHVKETAPDELGEARVVLVFRLLPVGPSADDPHIPTVLDATTAGESALVELESVHAGHFAVKGTAPTTALRREAELVEHFRRHLAERGHQVRRWRLRPPGEIRSLLTDLYDEDENVLYEAKGSVTRDSIRRGIGQLLDYRRHIPSDPQLALLLPQRPADDLVDLVSGLGIRCVYEQRSGYFVDATEGPE